MPTLVCVLGQDAEDAALNRPVVILRPEELDELLALLATTDAPFLALLLEPDGPAQRVLGASALPAARAELAGALATIGAPGLPERLVLALALQRLAVAQATASEFGLNLYATLVADADEAIGR